MEVGFTVGVVVGAEVGVVIAFPTPLLFVPSNDAATEPVLYTEYRPAAAPTRPAL